MANTPNYEGKIYSMGLDDKWLADVMVLPAESSVRHGLVAQDVFSRCIRARPMISQAAVIEPMHNIMRTRRPRVL